MENNQIHLYLTQIPTQTCQLAQNLVEAQENHQLKG